MSGFLISNHALLSHGVRALAFLAFVVVALSVGQAPTPQIRRKRLSWFLAYTLGASALAGFTQRDYWPFSAYQLMQGIWDENFPYRRILIVGVDEAGVEFQAPSDSWSPLSPFAIQEWMRETYPRLPEARKAEALAFLLARAESARSSRWSHPGSNPAWYESLRAPNWWLSASVRALPKTAFVGLRVYEEEWVPAVKWATGRESHRTLIDTWPR